MPKSPTRDPASQCPSSFPGLLYQNEPLQTEPDDYDDDDLFSDYESASDNLSIASSIRDYIYENGRRYHCYGGEGKYVLPNDEVEQKRLDLMHHIQLMVLGGELHMAPAENPKRVLDCGTGTGVWALDFGDSHPESKVTGVDLSPIQPDWASPNVQFEVDDLEKEWTWPQNHFDFIHIRSICNGIRDYQRLINQSFHHTAPGGWTELSELSFSLVSRDDTISPDTALALYLDCIERGYSTLGIANPNAASMKECMRKAGYVDIEERTFLIPCGPWPKNRKLKDLGATFALVGPAGFEAYGLAAMTRALGMATAEAKELCRRAHADLLNARIHACIPAYYVYGRKPEW
ncbi:putative methyltransferase [Ascodesmis nigricans]|uniref:Putative methyltransferase n=1 Tax=Ascodesmis nigricans TaxID=341454 RepID=A0A4V6RHB4_9PEZI|nr:putative methyltransferase [Ascodesmis nigricans]